VLILFVVDNDAAYGFHPEDELLLLQLLDLVLQRLFLLFIPAVLAISHLVHLLFVVYSEGPLLFSELRLVVDLKVFAQKFQGMQVPILKDIDLLHFLVQEEVFLPDLEVEALRGLGNFSVAVVRDVFNFLLKFVHGLGGDTTATSHVFDDGEEGTLGIGFL
jgi:hypothetical protein